MEESLEDIDNQDFSEEIPASEGSIVGSIIAQIASGIPFSRITLPTFILETRSTIQRFTDWMQHADILRKIPDEEDPLFRCLHLATWIVSGFHLGSMIPKKPYNSVLGEVYRAVLQNADGSVGGVYEAEQVSHHPPISAFSFSDRKGNCAIWGHTEMRSKFNGNSAAALMDHENTVVNYECLNRGETYVFNFPDLYACGIMFGRLRTEVRGQVRIRCEQTGVSAVLNFEEKPFFGGRYNCVNGSIYKKSRRDPTKRIEVIQLSGRWSAYLKAYDKRTKKSWLTFDVRNANSMKIVVPPLSEQSPYESQYLWQGVTRYLSIKDTTHATDHKFAIEEKQRKERKYFEDNHVPWEYQLFHFDEQTKRYVPNNLNLTPYSPDEPPQEMPPQYKVPARIQEAIDAGYSETVDQMQSETQSKIDSETNT